MHGRVSFAVPPGIDLTQDPAMPFLGPALDPSACTSLFSGVPGLLGPGETLSVTQARLLRHKPGRRFLVHYRITIEGSDGRREESVLGKGHARGVRPAAYRMQRALWEAGLRPGAGGNVEVPEPLGLVPELGLWLQRHIPGQPVGELLHGPAGKAAARWSAEALVRLHRVTVPLPRVHEAAKELSILAARLAPLREQTGSAPRIDRLLQSCARILTGMRRVRPRAIHRDFYPDQVIVADRRVVLIDLDTLCLGDPALDVGNFLAHVVERALRLTGDPAALDSPARAFVDRYRELEGDLDEDAIRGWTTVALARLAGLSTTFPDRRDTLGPLLELCEGRLAMEGSL
jgi:hypothetical protein